MPTGWGDNISVEYFISDVNISLKDEEQDDQLSVGATALGGGKKAESERKWISDKLEFLITLLDGSRIGLREWGACADSCEGFHAADVMLSETELVVFNELSSSRISESVLTSERGQKFDEITKMLINIGVEMKRLTLAFWCASGTASSHAMNKVRDAVSVCRELYEACESLAIGESQEMLQRTPVSGGGKWEKNLQTARVMAHLCCSLVTSCVPPIGSEISRSTPSHVQLDILLQSVNQFRMASLSVVYLTAHCYRLPLHWIPPSHISSLYSHCKFIILNSSSVAQIAQLAFRSPGGSLFSIHRVIEAIDTIEKCAQDILSSDVVRNDNGSL